jgi:glycosyltransferase involved in cell wall biosynthesis
MTGKTMISVVVPVYNEELIVAEAYKRLKAVMEAGGEAYEIIFVDDGSRDNTAALLEEICSRDRAIKLIAFSRNFGHQIAITAGMDYSSGDAVVVIDGDLQDPPEVIPAMIEKWREGYEVVYGRRVERKGDGMSKKLTAAIFYRFLRKMTDVDIPVDAGDFRLIDRKVCDALKQINERNRYIRGIISWLGFKQTGVEFRRDKRYAGQTKYPLKKMMRFAFDAITSFSYKPLKLASYAGILVSFCSFLYLIVVVLQRLFIPGSTIQGWASTMAVNLFFNGIMLIILGIIGEYVGRIYDEAKGRPLYIIRDAKNIDAVGIRCRDNR